MKKVFKAIGIVVMMLSLLTVSVSTYANSIPEDPPGTPTLPPPPPSK